MSSPAFFFFFGFVVEQLRAFLSEWGKMICLHAWQPEYMCMVNRKDDYAVSFNPQLSPLPSLCVLTDLWLKGRLGLHPAVKMPPPPPPHPRTTILTPLHTGQCVSVTTLLWDLLLRPCGSHINALIKIWMLFPWVPCVCSASGQVKPKLGPFTQLLLNVNWPTIVYPSPNGKAFDFYVSVPEISFSGKIDKWFLSHLRVDAPPPIYCPSEVVENTGWALKP